MTKRKPRRRIRRSKNSSNQIHQSTFQREWDALTPEHTGLWNEVDALRRATKKAFRPSHPARMIFRPIELEAEEGSIPPPSMEMLKDIERRFYKLPAANLRWILHDWSPCRRRPKRESMIGHKHMVVRCMKMIPGYKGAVTFHEFELHQDQPCITLSIPEGTTLDAVAGALAMFQHKALSEWPSLISGTVKVEEGTN